jgi:undecaprenyl-diphosphatase
MEDGPARHGPVAADRQRAASGALPAVLLFGAFALLAAAVTAGYTQAADERVLLWLALHRTTVLDQVMSRASRLGDGIVLLMIVLVSATFLWLTHHRWFTWVLGAGVVGGMIANNLLKLLFARPRPDVIEQAADVATKSFPSGHAMSSIIVYGTVAWIVSRLEATHTTRVVTWILAGVVILVIGSSRMYLGVHYPSDVGGGFLAGAAWVVLVASSARAARRFGRQRTPV